MSNSATAKGFKSRENLDKNSELSFTKEEIDRASDHRIQFMEGIFPSANRPEYDDDEKAHTKTQRIGWEPNNPEKGELSNLAKY